MKLLHVGSVQNSGCEGQNPSYEGQNPSLWETNNEIILQIPLRRSSHLTPSTRPKNPPHGERH